jgi:hypothetical protein
LFLANQWANYSTFPAGLTLTHDKGRYASTVMAGEMVVCGFIGFCMVLWKLYVLIFNK